LTISSTFNPIKSVNKSERNQCQCSSTGFEPLRIEGREVYLKSGGSILVMLISFFNYFLLEGRELPSSFALGYSWARKILLVVIDPKFNTLYGTSIYSYFKKIKKEG